MEHDVIEFDKAKTKIMNYIMYKKRTEYEVKNKFCKTIEENLLNDIIEYVKQAGYLSDADYIKKIITEFQALNNLSRREVRYKLYSKGISNDLVEEYFIQNAEELLEYELNSAKNIIYKKQLILERNDIINYLRKKGYNEDIINEAIRLADNKN